jgi:DNA repair exonuclease SbcCD ATPase subunit
MSDLRPSKKRMLDDTALASSQFSSPSATAITTLTTSTAGSASSYATTHQVAVLQQQVELLQADLEHERSMRELDVKKEQQLQRRLRKQLEWAVEEADQAKQMLEETQEKTAQLTAQWKQARNQALQDLRQCQIELEEARGERDDGEAQVWEEKCQYLEDKLEISKETEEALRDEISSLQQTIQNNLAEYQPSVGDKQQVAKSYEEAPPAIMSELARVRTILAETECNLRQMKRSNDDLKQQNKRLLKEREQAALTGQRTSSLTRELDGLRKDYEISHAENEQWKKLATSLQDNLGIKLKEDHTPEISTIMRHVEKSRQRIDELEKQRNKWQERVKELEASMQPLESKIREVEFQEREASRKYSLLQSENAELKQKMQTLEAQQNIYKRECDSLRSLIKTFDDLPYGPKETSGSVSTSTKTLEVSLSSAQEELTLVRGELDRLQKELVASQQAWQDKVTELETVKDKFGKLRDALHAERDKVAIAEQRAHDAEVLAGKGAFNPEHTRVMHIKETPLTEALREEVKVLQRQVEVLKGDAKSAGKGASADPEKLNKRLKENFKEQISLFREGVYLMTGYKVDMLPGTDRPTFRVRSVFGEKEEDHLMFKWPKQTTEVTSLDILSTPFAKELTSTPSYEYMTKFHNLPAFLSSVQLSLFEKQTIMM